MPALIGQSADMAPTTFGKVKTTLLVAAAAIVTASLMLPGTVPATSTMTRTKRPGEPLMTVALETFKTVAGRGRIGVDRNRRRGRDVVALKRAHAASLLALSRASCFNDSR
jgi:hypothetical protein